MARSFALVAIAFAALRPIPVEACQCIWSTPETMYDRATVVFVGTLHSVEMYPPKPNKDGDPAYELEVVEAFKGALPERVWVYSTLSNCRAFFDFGVDYLVYAWTAPNGTLNTSSCSRTVSVEHHAHELDRIRKFALHYPGFVVSHAARTVAATGAARVLSPPACDQPPAPDLWLWLPPLDLPPAPSIDFTTATFPGD